MSQEFSSTPEVRPWLRTSHKERKERSFTLGKAAIDTLTAEGIPVTLKNIQEKSRELDTLGKGIHSNTIKTNEQLNAYYKAHSKDYKKKRSKSIPKSILAIKSEMDLVHLKPDRNLDLVRRKYVHYSKQELIEKLILTEQYIAQNQQIWKRNLFNQSRNRKT